MPHLIEVVTEIDAARDAVFDLELDMDVHAASLAGSGETATTSTGRRRAALGDEVTFRARHFGLVWRMTSRVTAHDAPRRFVDELAPYLRRLLTRRAAYIKQVAEARP